MTSSFELMTHVPSMTDPDDVLFTNSKLVQIKICKKHKKRKRRDIAWPGRAGKRDIRDVTVRLSLQFPIKIASIKTTCIRKRACSRIVFIYPFFPHFLVSSHLFILLF